MKYIICLLFSFIHWDAGKAQRIATSGDKSFNVTLISPDTNHIKVYAEKEKYDTIGPLWRLVSDTARGHWNPASAMMVWEVTKNGKPIFYENGEAMYSREHSAWLDSNCKPLKQVVWRAEIQK